MSAACRVSLLLLLAVLTMDLCDSASIQGYEQRMSEEVMVAPKKRPFCNAFTGCGRKRSSPTRPIPELVRQRQYVDEDAFVPLMESDNAIEELSRQILSEAKLWEAIQEASAEIARRKQREAYRK
ncbi:cardioactive peptide [Maniola hyperantus]|uniref:cardioactive peptide n=1 Tax=Aphantopus hyperantus TaxID=2795564 RepID=UPI00156A4E6F|nr:cardioactive peptide [Maniola hyperantus]